MRRRREREGKVTNERVDDVLARLMQLEMNSKGTPEIVGGACDEGVGWRPRHVILCGWQERSTRENREGSGGVAREAYIYAQR